MKVKLNYVDVLYITPNDFKKNGSQYIFKTGVESDFFNLVLQTVRNIAASQNFKQFGLRVFSAKGYEQFTNQYLNAKDLPSVCFIDFDNPNDSVFRVLTTLNKSEITENRLYDLSDYFAALKKESGIYYQKDGKVWADLRKGEIDLGKKQPNSKSTEGSDSEFEANKNGEGFLPIYIPLLSELSEIIDEVLENIAPDFKQYIYLGIAGLAVTGAVSSDKKGKKVLLGSIAAYSLYRFYNINKKKSKSDSMKTDKQRGSISFAVFNKNFGNIRNAGLKYSFEITPEGNGYKMFLNWSDGAAGMLVHLFRYISGRLYKNDVKRTTIELIINTWAPSFENETENYIDFVAKKTGIARNAEIAFSPATMYLICKAMSQMEDNKATVNFTAEMFPDAWKTAQIEIKRVWGVIVPDFQYNVKV